MAYEDPPGIVSVDRFRDSIIIGFQDGKCGRYSAELLYSILPRSEELFEPATDGNFDEPDGQPRESPELADDNGLSRI